MKIVHICDKKRQLQLFAIIFLFIYVFYAVFLNFSFTSDHVFAYTVRPNVAKPVFMEYLAGGRPAVYLLVWIEYFLGKININSNVNQYVYQILLMLMLSCAVYQLYCLFSEVCMKRHKDILYIVVLIIGFVNPYIVEAFVYKAIEWGVAINLVCFAVRLFCKKRYFCALPVLWFGVSIYQSYFALFLIYATVYLYMQFQGKICKEVIMEAVKMYFITGICTVSNILLVRLSIMLGIIEREVKTVDLATSSLAERLIRVKEAFSYSVIDCYGEMFPPYFLVTVIVVLILFICAIHIRNKRHIVDVFYFIWLAAALILYPIAIFSVVPGGGFHQRITWPVFAVVSMLFMLLFYYTDSNGLKEKIGFFVLMMFWGANIFHTETIINDFFISNKIDTFIAKQILAEIDRYEEESGVQIEYISAVRAESSKNVYTELNLSYDALFFGRKTIAQSWSDVYLIDYLSGRDYDKAPMDEDIYDTYFRGRTWETFNADEQLVFRDNIMYWAIY